MERSRSFGNCRLLYLLFGAFLINYSAVCGQNVTCGPVSSATANIFSTYNVSVSGSDNYTLTYDPVEYAPGNRMPLGTSQVTATATNTSSTMNVIGSCVFNVTVDITELPVTCPETIVRELPADAGTFDLMTSPPTADNLTVTLPEYSLYGDLSVDIVSIINTDGSAEEVSMVPVGVHNIMLLANDTVLTSTCSSLLEIKDVTPPELSCVEETNAVNNLFFGLMSGSEYNVADAHLDTSGNSRTYNVSISLNSPFLPGYTPVAFTVTDLFGNAAQCAFQVFNSLTEMPVDCPPLNETIYTVPGKPYSIFTSTLDPSSITPPFTYDFYGGSVFLNVSASGQPNGSHLDTGVHEVTAVIYDDILQKTCIGFITVKDAESPNITCTDVEDDMTNVISFSALAVDNVNASIGYSVPAGSRFLPGLSSVTATAIDAAGNTDSCNFTVTVQIYELPVACREAIVREREDGQATFNLSTSPPTADDVVLTLPDYSFYGDVSVDVVSIAATTGEEEDSSTLSDGFHDITLRVSDTVLATTCTILLEVNGPVGFSSTTLALIITCAIVGGVLLLVIAFVVADDRCSWKRRWFGSKEPARNPPSTGRNGVATDSVRLSDSHERALRMLHSENVEEMTEDSKNGDFTVNGGDVEMTEGSKNSDFTVNGGDVEMTEGSKNSDFTVNGGDVEMTERSKNGNFTVNDDSVEMTSPKWLADNDKNNAIDDADPEIFTV